MPAPDQNIIGIIQEMIKDGQNEKAIVQNLRELGVAKEKAEKLMLIAQSDVLPVLQSEINRVVDKKLAEKKLEIVRSLQSELQLAEEKTGLEVKTKNQQEMKEFEKYLETKFSIVQSQVNENIRKSVDTSDRVREKLLLDENRIQRLEMESGGRKEAQVMVHKTANIFLAGLGVLFALATAYIFYGFTLGGTAVTAEALIVGVVLGLISVTVLFVSTLF